MLSPFFTVTARSFQALPPVACPAVFGKQRDVFRNDPGLETGVRIGRAVGRVSERSGAARRQARDLVAGAGAAGPVRGVAHAGDDLVDRKGAGELGARQDQRQLARHVGDFGVGLGAGLLVHRDAVGAGLRQHLLRVERRHAGRVFGAGQHEVRGDAVIRAHAHHLAVADLDGGADADELALAARLAGRRQAVGLAGELLAHAADGAAQRAFDPLGNGGEVGLAVERRKNGAAHQSRAAHAGENRAGEPLHRDATAIDDVAVAAVD